MRSSPAAFTFAMSLTLMSAVLSFPAHAGEAVTTQFISGQIDLLNDSIVLPLHKGSLKDGRSVWYVLTDSSDQATSRRLGIGYSPSLALAAQARGTRTATYDSKGEMIFDAGSVDFAPNRAVNPGPSPDLFPPVSVQPGSLASPDYSPLARLLTEQGDTVVFDAPILAFDLEDSQIAFCEGSVPHTRVHDRVLKICPKTREVTLSLARGYSGGKELVYLTFDANIPLASALEGDTHASALDALKGTGAVLPLYAVTNGQTGVSNPERQGFNSALMGDGSPLNVLASFPTLEGGYSPIWDIQGVQWTSQAIGSLQTHLLKSASDVFTAFQSHQLVGLGGGPIQTLGILVNCPAVALIQ